MSSTPQFLTGLFLLWMLIWPIVVNSQPGNSFVVLGIDWKADNLDGTLFWVGVLLMIANGTSAGYTERQKTKRFEQ